MSPYLINALTFFAVFVAIFAMNSLLTDLRTSERRRLKQRMEDQIRMQHRQRVRKSSLSQNFSQIAVDAAAESRSQRKLRERLQFLVEQSGLNVTSWHLLCISSVLALLLAVVVGVLLESWPVALLAGVVAGVLPLLYILWVRRRRLGRLRSQLPDAFDLMSRVLRAGQTVSQAIQSVSDEFSQPISLEFLYCYEQMNLGLSPEDALRDLSRRTGLLEIKIFVLAVLVHRQTGGNLAELLDKLAHVVRERFRIQGMIQSLTAQGRLQGAILLGLPPFMFLLLFILHPDYIVILLDHPTLIIIALTMMGMGAIWVRRVVNFDF